MSHDATIVLGIPVPSVDPVFLAVVRFHVVVGIVCVLAGVTAMLSRKARGRHSTWGTIYYLLVPGDRCRYRHGAFSGALVRELPPVLAWHRFFDGSNRCAHSAAAALAQLDEAAHHRHGSSYILMLTAFYVDNGKNLPIWKELPQIAFWLLPAGLGIPLLVYALLRHPLAQQERLTI